MPDESGGFSLPHRPCGKIAPAQRSFANSRCPWPCRHQECLSARVGSKPNLLHRAANQIQNDQLTNVSANHNDRAVLAFDISSLVALSQRADCIIELVPQVGDPLIRVFGGRLTFPEKQLKQSVAVGMERTMEQDPTFAFRIMVDIASKGLSPAINDPTTAVLAIDQIHHLLRYVASRNLATGQVHDSNGQLRIVYRTPEWEDSVRLGVTEIRHFGGESIQIARRLKAMLENLIQNPPESRTKWFRQELAILRRSAERFFSEPEDRA